MNAKIRSIGFIVVIFVTFSIVYYEIVIGIVAKDRVYLEDLTYIRKRLVISDNEAEIQKLIAQADKEYAMIEQEIETMYRAFVVV